MIHAQRWKASLVFAASLSFLLLIDSAAFSDEPVPGGRVHTIVYLIKASNDMPGVDPEIRHIVREFQGAFKYSTYRLVSKVPKDIAIGSDEKIALPGLREMQIYAKGYENNRIKLRVRIKEKQSRGGAREVLDTDFRIMEGGTIIIGGYHYQEDKLILAISAEMR
jgi:hypothetical protein